MIADSTVPIVERTQDLVARAVFVDRPHNAQV